MHRSILTAAMALALGLTPLQSVAQAQVAASPVAPAQAPRATKHKNFKVAIYVVVNATKRLADPVAFEREYERAQSQIGFDKVYLEVYRDRNFATPEEVAKVKANFLAKGIEVAGGVTPAAGGRGGQFGTFDYELKEDREEAVRAIQIAAREFDEVILDDFFFYTSKSDEDIAAKGKRTWTQYRLDTMRAASRDLILKPARAVNPNVKVIIKYPNWYEHFQGLGYDLEQQPHMFDGIYTGTETRDPDITDQFLQQYESYLVYRYYSNIRPTGHNGGNGGGWVDTFSTRYVDRYAEQLWDTLFAKAPEITLFSWHPVGYGEPAVQGERSAWAKLPTTFDWDEMVRGFKPGPGETAPGWGTVAGYSLRKVDEVLGYLGKPVGIAAYKPHHSYGEDFLHNYLGNIGLPIELMPTFPANAHTVLLTESARHDPKIVEKIQGQLKRGGNVVLTSGLVRALQHKGMEHLLEVEASGRVANVSQFVDGYGAGNGASLNDTGKTTDPILFPEMLFYTNDTWSIIRGVAGSKGYPILMMNRYSNGIIYVLTVPENPADLYRLPVALTSRIKGYIQETDPVRIEAEPLVSLFTYDNGAFVVQSFRDTPTTVKISVKEGSPAVRALPGNAAVPAQPAKAPPARNRNPAPARTEYLVTIQPHSFQTFTMGR